MAHIIRQFMGAGFGTTYSFDAFDPFRAMWRREQIGDIRRAAEELADRQIAYSSTITASAELPGTAHYIPPSPVPVGETNGGGAVVAAVIRAAGAGLPTVGVRPSPDFVNTGQPPIIFSPAPIILPGQTDPGREEQESEEGPMAHTWLHLGSQVIGGMFPSTVASPAQFAFSGPTNLPPAMPSGSTVANGGATVAYSGGSCPPMKTRTLTIDCATGLEVKRRRRRRPKLLTQGDMGVLFQIASLPNNANVRVALAGAIRR